MRTNCVAMMNVILGLGALALIASPAYASPGDFDGSGYVGPEDLATFLSCLTGPNVPPNPGCEVADLGVDNAIDLIDFAMFQTLYGHVPIPLQDTLGNTLAVASTAPYSPRQTCGLAGCHDVDAIANGYHFQQGRTDADGNIIMQDDFFGDGRFFVRSPGMFGKW